MKATFTAGEPDALRTAKTERAFNEGLVLGRIQDLRELAGMTLAEAQAQVGESYRHATFYRRLARMKESGWRGLLDQRSPPAPKMTAAIGGFVEGVARSKPERSSAELVNAVVERFGVQLSVRTIQAKLQTAGLSRPSSRFPKKQKDTDRERPTASLPPCVSREEPSSKEELGGAGLAWLTVASEVTGYGRELAQTIVDIAQAQPPPLTPVDVDRSHRDEKGRFLPEYNAPRPRQDPQVGAVFDTIDVKRLDKDLRRLSIATTKVETVEKKLLALMALPVVSERGRFDGVTDPRGEWLHSLGGHDYQPETLAKFARELKWVGAGFPLIECHARVWHRELSVSLGEDASSLILYVDGTTKPYWTEFFSRSGKVATVGRVMPCLETILIHSGAGVPLYLKTFAGSASLVSNLLPMLHEMEGAIGKGMLGRLTVVDGGMNSVALFKAFDEDGKRPFITPLRHNQVKDLSQVQDLTPLVPYRDGDSIAGGWMTLSDSKDRKAPPYKIRVIVLKRRTKATFAAYGSNTPPEDFSDEQLMDAYFQRWPAQEHIFRELNGGAAFKAIHGYGKCQVINFAVIDEITKLTTQTENASRRLEEARALHEESARNLQALEEHQRAQGQGEQVAQAEAQNTVLKLRLARAEQEKRTSAVERIQEQIERKTREREVLETRRTIYETDTELDQILSVLKLGCALLVQVLLHRFFGGLAIEFNTFINQIFALPGTRIVTDTAETIRFHANRRNPELMEKLEGACLQFNATNHRRNGRAVRFEVAWPPGGRRRRHAT